MLTRLLTLVIALTFLASCGTTSGTGSSGANGEGTIDIYGDTYPRNPEAGTQGDLAVNVGDRVFFGYDSAVLNSEAQSTLEKQAAWLQTHSSLTITVEGHCDERGTREYNLALGERRAASTRNYLISLGVAPHRVSTISYGKERPAVLGSNDDTWRLNRRGVSVVN